MNWRQLKQQIRESQLAGRLQLALERERAPRASHRQPPILFFPGELYTGTSGDLRSAAIAHELCTLGWRAITVPPWLPLAARRALLAKEPRALAVFQQARHPFNQPSLYPGTPCLFDSDDADILTIPERVLPCLRESHAVIAGSGYLAEAFKPYSNDITTIWTGTYITDVPRPATNEVPVLVWAQSNPFDYPHEADLVRSLWISLAEAGLRFSVAVYTNETARATDWLAPLHQHNIHLSIRPKMRYRDFVKSLGTTDIGLQPICTTFAYSKGKSFGKVLAYLAARSTVVASDEVDHRLFFRNNENGLLVSTPEEWFEACRHLIQNPAERQRLAATAHTDFLARMTTRHAAEAVVKVLERVSKRIQAKADSALSEARL